MMSNKRVPPPTHYQGGPAAAADAAFWLLRNRRRGSVVPAPPLGGAGRVALLWCGVCRRCAPPLFQMFPVGRKRPPSHRSPPAPGTIRAGGAGGRLYALRSLRPKRRCRKCPGQGPGAVSYRAPAGYRAESAASYWGVRRWPVGHHARVPAAIRPPVFCALRGSAPRVLPVPPRIRPPLGIVCALWVPCMVDRGPDRGHILRLT